jgi:hypothetical protein
MEKIMKTSKTILALVIAQAFCLFIPQAIFSQTETQDIIKYTPPRGWAKTPKDGAMVYVDMNKTSGAFCILTVYSSTPSSGSPQKDFAAQWDGLLVKPFKAAANPKTETQTNPEGWQATVGGADIEFDGNKAAAILTVFSGFGKTASILALVNDESYMAQVDALVAGVKLDKTASNPNVGVQTPSADFLDFDPFPDKPHFQPQKPLLGRLRKTITMADLAGKWQIGGANVTSYFNSSSGNYSSTDTTFSGEWYTIRADGTFDTQFQGRTGNHTVRETASGTIILEGGFITFKYKQKPAMRYQFVTYMDAPRGAAVLTLIYIGDNAPLSIETLRAGCAHAYGWVTCTTGEEFVRIP